MELAEAYRLIEVFKEKAAAKRQEDRWAIEQQIQFDDDRKKKREQHVREKEEKERLEAMVLASVQQIETFSGQLDTYDTATVQALMHNGAALDDLRHRRDALEGSAYRLPDGQIAIKSDDGKRALDRHGAELPSGTVDPDAIPDALRDGARSRRSMSPRRSWPGSGTISCCSSSDWTPPARPSARDTSRLTPSPGWTMTCGAACRTPSRPACPTPQPPRRLPPFRALRSQSSPGRR